MKVYKLTKAQADEIDGFLFHPQCVVKPIENNGNMVITMEVVNDLVIDTFSWVKDLPQIDYVEPIETK